MNNLAIITAKGNSYRLPKKNIADICGRPAIAYVIDIAKASGVCDKVIVSTDCDKIRGISLQYGADDVVMRDPDWIDEWQFNATMTGTIQKYEQQIGQKFDDCTLINGIAVFLRPSWIRMAVNVLRNHSLFDVPLIEVHPGDIYCFCQCISITRFGIAYYNQLSAPHYGINLDIDYPKDLVLTRDIMQCIQEGRIDYSLDEHIHDNENYIKYAMQRAERPRWIGKLI